MDTPRNITISIAKEQLTENLYFRLTYGIVLGMIFMCSVSGGLFVAFVIRTHNLMRKRIWFYLFILALSDTATSLFAIPIMIAATFHRHILLIQWVCAVNMFSITFFGSWSVFTMATLSYYKYLVISKPFDTFGRDQNWTVRIYISVTLITSLFFAGSPLLGFSGYTYLGDGPWCSIRSANPRLDLSYTILLAVFVYFIPLSVIITCSIRTYVAVKNQNTLRMRMQKASTPEIHTEQVAVLKTLFVIVTVFMVLWTPKCIHVLLHVAGISVTVIFSYIVYALIFLQGTINPVIYYFRQYAFKEELKKMFRKNGNEPGKQIHLARDEIVSFDTQSSVYSIRSPLSLIFPSLSDSEYPVTFNSTSYRSGNDMEANIQKELLCVQNNRRSKRCLTRNNVI